MTYQQNCKLVELHFGEKQSLIFNEGIFFGALAGWLLLNEMMTAREIFGCVLMIFGMLATQWALIKKSL